MAKEKYSERIVIPEPIVKVPEVSPLFTKTDFPQTKVNNGEGYEVEKALDVNKYDKPYFLHQDLERPEYATAEEVFAAPVEEKVVVEEPAPIVEEEVVEEEEITEEEEEEEDK